MGLDPNVHIEFHPSFFFSRLDIYKVVGLIAIAKDWALDNLEHGSPNRPIEHGEFWKSLAEGVLLKMSAAPGKRLTYGLVVETLDRLMIWEKDQYARRSTARAVDFAVLENGIVKGAGSIRKDRSMLRDE